MVFNCSKVDRPSIELDGIWRSWTSWEDIDSGAWVEKVKNKDGQWEWVDLVRKFFAKLQLDSEDSGVVSGGLVLRSCNAG